MTMRAKFKVTHVEQRGTVQDVSMTAVTDAPYDKDGNSDDNSFAKWTPGGELKMCITNPALAGALKEGEKYDLDFTLAPK